MRVKIRKGDTVEIISGKIEEKGKRGEVIKVLPDEHRLVVQGVNQTPATGSDSGQNDKSRAHQVRSSA
jgi:ribosomal protein L24